MSEINKQLSEINTNNFEKKDVQNLLKSLDDFVDSKILRENDFSKLDDKNSELSDSEKKLYELYSRLGDNKDMIDFLKKIINNTENTIITNKESNAILTKKPREISEKEKNILYSKLNDIIKSHKTKEYIEKAFLSDGRYYGEIEKFLLNPKNRDKLKIVVEKGSFSFGLCPSDGGKKWKDIYIKNEKENILDKLKGYKYNNGTFLDAKKIFNSKGCEPIKLAEKLKGLIGPNGEKLSQDEINNILDGTMTIKKITLENNLYDILNNYGIDIDEFKNKSDDEINIILNKKEVPDDVKKIVLEKNQDLKEIKKIKKEIKNILEKTTNYNNLSDKYFIENPSSIKNINDQKKLFNILKIIKDTKGFIKYNFNSLVNKSLQGEINVLLEYSNITKRKLSYANIKDLKILNKNEKLKLISVLDDNAIDMFLLSELDNENYIINNISNINLKNKVENFYKQIKNEKVPDNPLKLEGFFDKNLDIILTEKKLIDNYIVREIKNKNKNNLKKIFNVINSLNLYLILPKTLSYILGNSELTKNIISIFPDFYTYYLPNDKQEEYSEYYIESILKNNIKNKEEAISEIKFKNKKQVLLFFNKINLHNKTNNNIIDLNKIIQYDEIRITLINIISDDNKSNIQKNLTKEEKHTLNSIKEIMKNYSSKIEEYKEIFKESGISEKIKTKNNIINNIYKNQDFTNYILELNSNLQGPFVGFLRSISGDLSKDENDTYFTDILKYTETAKEFSNILKKINILVDKALIEQNKIDESKKLSSETKKQLDAINPNYLQNNGENIKYSGIDDAFEEFLLEKKKTLEQEGKKINKNDFEQYINEFLEKTKLDTLDREWEKKIYSHIDIKKKNNFLSLLAKESENNPDLYNAYKNGNQEEIDRILNNIDEKYYKKLEEKHIKFNEVSQIDNNTEYKVQGLLIEQTKDSYSININGKKINGLSKKEIDNIGEEINGNFIITKPEALKNLVDFKEKMEILNLGFVWENRSFLVKQLNILKGTSGIDIEDNDNMNKVELNKLLNFVLEVIGEKGSDNINSTYSKIVDLNGNGMLNNKTDTITGFSNIGKEFYKKGYINLKGGTISSENINKIQDRTNWDK